MSEFKKGDRVEVKFEAVVTHQESGGEVLVTGAGLRQFWITTTVVTKLHDPLPTSSCAVIRIVENGDYPRVFELTGLAVWRETGNSSPFEAERIQALADEHGFTVLYAGDDA